MANDPRPYPARWLLLGGIGFGLYFTAGLAYFEVFRKCNGWSSAHFVGVALVFIAASVAMAFGLFGQIKWRGRPLATWVKWLLLPALCLLLADAAVYLYAGLVDAFNFRTDIVLPGIASTTLLLGLLPVQVALVLIPQRGGQRPQPQANGQETEPAVQETVSEAQSPSMFRVEASHGEPMFQIPAADLILVEAADNYCKIHHLKDGVPKMKMLRLTLKEAEESLQEMTGFHRCHRSFLVNGSWVVEVQGNSQAHRLKMAHLEDLVPVSRSFDVALLKGR